MKDYKDDNVWLMHGDCLERMKEIPDESVDLVLTDPPFGTTSCKWDSVIPFEPMWAELKRIIKPNGATVLFGSEPFSSALRMSNIKQYKYDWYWIKNRATGFLNSKKQPLRHVELISVFYAAQPVYNPQMTSGHQPTRSGAAKVIGDGVYRDGLISKGCKGKTERYPKNTIHIKASHNGYGRLHPTQKPVELMEYLIKTYTNEGDTVLDFTAGSGSTGVACRNLNRKFIGIEMDDGYFDIAKERILSR